MMERKVRISVSMVSRVHLVCFEVWIAHDGDDAVKDPAPLGPCG